MITLYTFGPAFGLPDPSPFVTKAQMLLKLAGLAFAEDRTGFAKAPKGKLPYLDDNGVIVADSTFIRFHIEKAYGFDFDEGLSPEQRATAWAVEKMCEDHLYWVMLAARWLDDANFAKGPIVFFNRAPAPIRPFVIRMVRGKVRKALTAHGIGRHSQAEIDELAARDVDTLAALLGDKPCLLSQEPKGVDATAFAFIAGSLCERFDTKLRTAAEAHANLLAYRDRMLAKFYPEFRRSA
ncbi:MAG: glutathione S-transferase family protein [Hyphomicrobiales bacterium]